MVLAARKEGASSFLARIAYRLAPHFSCARESESRENSRFAIGDFTCRLLCGQHCCDIVSNCCNIQFHTLRIYSCNFDHLNFTTELGCLRPLRGSAYLVFRFYKVINRAMKHFDKLCSLLLFIHSPRQAQNPSLTLVAIKWA